MRGVVVGTWRTRARYIGIALPALLACVVVPPARAQEPAGDANVGRITELTIPSRSYPAGRHAWVYTPAGYPAACTAACDLIVTFDGALYRAPMAEVLDSLITAKRIRPVVALLIDNYEGAPRIADLGNSQRFASFVAEEAVPWVREHYHVTRAPERTVAVGASAGGLGAAYVAISHPAVFGNVLSQSGGFWRGNEASNAPPYEYLTTRLAASPKLEIRFFVDVGSRETAGALGGRAPSLLDANRHLRDVLVRKGYRVDYYEVPGGRHTIETWRPRLPVGIVTLLSTAKEQ
jgi:enterochelin esterase-like enzyme